MCKPTVSSVHTGALCGAIYQQAITRETLPVERVLSTLYTSGNLLPLPLGWSAAHRRSTRLQVQVAVVLPLYVHIFSLLLRFFESTYCYPTSPFVPKSRGGICRDLEPRFYRPLCGLPASSPASSDGRSGSGVVSPRSGSISATSWSMSRRFRGVPPRLRRRISEDQHPHQR